MSCFRQHYFSGLTACLIVCSASAEAAIISLRNTATINGNTVRLGDIAQVIDADPAVVRQLSELLVAPSPGFGREDIIDLSMIRDRMRASGLNLSRIDFEGHSQVRITNPGARAEGTNLDVKTSRRIHRSADRVERTLTQAIERHLALLSPELKMVTVSLQLKPEEISHLYAGLGRGYAISGGKAPWDGPQRFAVEFEDTKRNRQQLVVAGLIEQRPMVLVAKHSIPGGSILRAEDLTWQRSDHPGQVVTQLENAVYFETKTGIRKGEPIVATDIRPVPLVRSNALITVTVRVAGITIQRQMKARSDGATGEMIAAVSLDGRDRLNAKVTGYNEAMVVLGGESQDQQPTRNTVIFKDSADDPLDSRPNSSNRYRTTGFDSRTRP